MRYAAISLTLNTLGSVALFFAFRAMGLMPHLGIAVATTLGGWLNAGLLYATLVRRGQFAADARLVRALPRIVLASLLMGAVLWAAAWVLAQPFEAQGTTVERVLALVALVGSGLVTYGLAALALGAVELRQFIGLLRRSPPAGERP